ncbi:MAG: hypothetical protein RQ748_12665 [Elusimicrobiales bacterium]|nr:hypothetical protein [Elusimicrobiales bacterium]
MRALAVILVAAVLAAGTARAQSTTQETVRDVVFSEIEKRVLKDVLGNGRYEAKGDGTYEKVIKNGKYDDLERGRDGKFYGKTQDKGKKGRGQGLPPGLAKKGKLPPGLQKQLERNGRLPPGLAGNPLPYEAVVNLPPPAPGTERAVVDTSVVLLEKGTGVILDVLTDVLARP